MKVDEVCKVTIIHDILEDMVSFVDNIIIKDTESETYIPFIRDIASRPLTSSYFDIHTRNSLITFPHPVISCWFALCMSIYIDTVSKMSNGDQAYTGAVSSFYCNSFRIASASLGERLGVLNCWTI